MSADAATTTMTSALQCNVIAATPSAALHAAAQAVQATLTSCAQLRVALVQAQHSAPAADAVLLVCDADVLNDTLDHIARLRAEHPQCALLVLTAQMPAAMLTALMSAGVYDFAAWSASADELVARLQRAVGLMPAAARIDMRCVLTPRMRNFVGTSAPFVRQIGKLPTFAGCDAGVLIVGETGTGKEVCAQAIHYLSARASKPWVAVNCGAIPTELVESELFGHVKGAYTNAHANREGLVREAEGGTLFLDDVDCLPLPAQAKLLRFLQEREYRAVGSNAVRTADVRIISASNKRLAQMVARGEFRQDLYFRLNVLNLDLPALRERREDIPALALHFIGQFAQQFGRAVCALSPRAVQRLLAHDWPGNVRELKHAIERAVLLCHGPALNETDLELTGPDEPVLDAQSFAAAKARVIERFERGYLETLLATHGGNITHAAQAASKNRRAFFELLRKHHIQPEQFRGVVGRGG